MKQASTAETTLKPLRDVYIVDGMRTPFLKARGKPGPFSAADLAVQAGRPLLARQPFSPEQFDEVIIGCVVPSDREANIARVISLRLGCGKQVPAWTVQRNCASGMQSLDSAVKDIAMGRHDLVLAGGTEAMSQAPLLFKPAMVNWFANWFKAKSLPAKLTLLGKLRPHYFAPVISLINGLTDHVAGIGMGQTAENVAHRFDISREQMDAFSLQSHQRVMNAQEKGYFANEIQPVYADDGRVFTADDGVRGDTTLERLAKLKPFFDKKFGNVTAGNSSQVTDGAALLILASEEAVKKYKLPVLGKIVDMKWAGVAPEEMGLGPVHATADLLTARNLSFADIDYWELNEAFAAQVLGCLAAWADADYCQQQLGLNAPLGTLDQQKLNVDGGAVAQGHPVGASGARIVLHLLHVLKRNKAQRGIATICIGGGQGGAMLVEAVS